MIFWHFNFCHLDADVIIINCGVYPVSMAGYGCHTLLGYDAILWLHNVYKYRGNDFVLRFRAISDGSICIYFLFNFKLNDKDQSSTGMRYELSDKF